MSFLRRVADGDGVLTMLTLTVILACLAILADAYTTRSWIMRGRTEDHRFRAFLIRSLGLNGGTYGVAVAWIAVVVVVNVYSAQPVWGLVAGNLITVALFGWAAWRNNGIARDRT